MQKRLKNTDLHLWLANHRLQKVYIRQRPSNHDDRDWQTVWRGTKQWHGNRRWIPPTWKLKLSTTKAVLAAFHFNNKEAKREVKVNHNHETLPFCSEPTYFGVTLDRTLTYRRHLESLRKELTSRVALLRPHAGSGWGAGATNNHLSPGPFNGRVLRTCLVPQCSHPPYWPHHHLANCDWMPASYTSGQPFYPRRHPTC